MSAPDVKFTREIRLGTTGKDVRGHKRALSRAAPDLYPWTTFTLYAGQQFMNAVVKWKRRVGLTNTQPVLGRTAHEKLERTRAKNKPAEWAFDAMAIRLCQEYWEATRVTPEQKVREAIVAAGFYWYANRGEIRYSQARPFQLRKPPGVPTRWDCSAFATNCHYAGGAPDPNGRGYDGHGYTGTLMSRGARVTSVAHLKPGDLIFYGYTTRPSSAFPVGSPTHVAVYVGVRDSRHSVLSLGSYPMRLLPYDYRQINHYRTYKVV